jgi:hypothetical protein
MPKDAWRWIVAAVAILLVVAFVAWAQWHGCQAQRQAGTGCASWI